MQKIINRYGQAGQLAMLLFITSASFGQKSINEVRANALRQPYPDEKIVAYSYSTSYSFNVQKDDLNITETDEMAMISLEGNVSASREVFYHDNVSITSSLFQSATGKIVETSRNCGNYEVDDIFYSDAKVCMYGVKFLHRGTEMTFKSSKVYDDARYLTKVFFHDELPVEDRTITFIIPHAVRVELVVMNFEGFDVKKTVATEAKGTRYTYSVKRIKAIKQESNSLGLLHYYPHVIVVTKEYTTSSGKKTVISSVGDLYKWYSKLVKEVKNDPATFKDEVSRLVAAAKTPEEKIRAIYYWVQDNIKYIAFEDGIAGFKPEAAQNVYHNRYGDCKGMANLTKEMLKVAGFDGRLTWIGTNRIPYTYSLPSLAVDNHMICTVNVGEKRFILDPTEKFIALGMNGERIQGKQMMIEDGDKYVIAEVPVADANQNLFFREETIKLEGEVLKGQGQIAIRGEEMKNILYLTNTIKKEDQKRLFNRLAVAEYSSVDNVETGNTQSVDRDRTLEIGYTFGLSNKITRFENDLYIDIDWEKRFKDLKMEDDRMTDYYFSRKVKNRTHKKLSIPPGYKISHLPPSIKKIHNDFSIVVNFEQKGQVLLYTSEITINRGIIKRSDFETWNGFIKELGEVYDDKVVLTKSN